MENEIPDDLQPEYDLKSLRVRKMGAQRTSFRQTTRLTDTGNEENRNAEVASGAEDADFAD